MERDFVYSAGEHIREKYVTKVQGKFLGWKIHTDTHPDDTPWTKTRFE